MARTTGATEWTVTAEGTGNQTATKTGEVGKSHYITGFIVAVDRPAVQTVEVKSGASTLLKLNTDSGVGAPLVVNFPHPLKIAAGQDAILVITDGSGGLAISRLNLYGFTR